MWAATHLAPVGAGIHERLDKLVDLGGYVALEPRLDWLRRPRPHGVGGGRGGRRCGNSNVGIQDIEGGGFEGVEGAVEEDGGEEGA